MDNLQLGVDLSEIKYVCLLRTEAVVGGTIAMVLINSAFDDDDTDDTTPVIPSMLVSKSLYYDGSVIIPGGSRYTIPVQLTISQQILDCDKTIILDNAHPVNNLHRERPIPEVAYPLYYYCHDNRLHSYRLITSVDWKSIESIDHYIDAFNFKYTENDSRAYKNRGVRQYIDRVIYHGYIQVPGKNEMISVRDILTRDNDWCSKDELEEIYRSIDIQLAGVDVFQYVTEALDSLLAKLKSILH